MKSALRFFLAASGFSLVSLTALAAPPANDNFASATTISGTYAAVTGTTIGATVETGEPSNSAFFDGASVWWKWTPAANGTVTFTTYGIGFDHEIDVWAGAAVNNLNFVAGSTGNAMSGTKFSFSAAKNVTYYIQVEGITNGSTAGPNFSGKDHSGTVRFALYQGTFAAPTVNTISGISGVATGQTMTFNSGASAAGSQTLVYQWYQTDPVGNSTLLTDGTLPSGETVLGSATAAIKLGSMPLSANQNQVALVVSNSDGSGTAVADPEQTSVFYSDEQIITQPTGTTTATTTNISGGGTASFTVVASGGPLPSFQWRKGATNVGSGVQASGSTFNVTNSFDSDSNENTSTLTITNAGTGDNGNYTCVVSNTTTQANSDTTTAIALTVTGANKSTQTPTITSSSSTTFGAAYTATGSGFGAATWSLGTGSTASGASINGSTGVIGYTSVGTVVIKVSYAGDSTHLAGTSANFTVTVGKASQSAPVISSATSATFGAAYTATANTGTGALSWALGSGSTATGAAINSSTGAVTYTSVGTVVITASFAGDSNHNSATSGNFTVTINKAAATFALNNTSFTYTGSAQGPTINPTPSNATFTSGGTTSATNAGSYTATATATGNFSGSNPSLGWTIAKANQTAPVVSSAAIATVGTGYTATANTGSGALSWALGTGSTAAGAAINATSGAVTFTGAGTVVIKATFAGDSNHNAATSASFTITVSAATTAAKPAMDFDGDGKNDLVWSNLTTGDRAIWYMDGITIKSFGYIAGIPTEWRIVGTGDIDGDGHNDLIWENVSTGDRTFWQMNNTTILNFGYLGLVDTAWHIAATGDFNGDGKLDVIWENRTTGDRAIWYLNNGAVSTFGYIAGIDTAWHIVAAADFDGDGKTDLLWENATTGDRSLWLMDGINILNFVYVAGVDPAWHIVAAVDINGDGKPDLIWENTTTGDRTVWYMNGATLAGMDYIAFVDPTWDIAP